MKSRLSYFTWKGTKQKSLQGYLYSSYNHFWAISLHLVWKVHAHKKLQLRLMNNQALQIPARIFILLNHLKSIKLCSRFPIERNSYLHLTIEQEALSLGLFLLQQSSRKGLSSAARQWLCIPHTVENWPLAGLAKLQFFQLLRLTPLLKRLELHKLLQWQSMALSAAFEDKDFEGSSSSVSQAEDWLWRKCRIVAAEKCAVKHTFLWYFIRWCRGKPYFSAWKQMLFRLSYLSSED